MDLWRAEAEGWIERLGEDHPEEFFHALRELIEERFPRGRGKPPGTGGLDDSARVDRIVELLRSGEVEDEDDAIRRVAQEDPGDSEKNTRRRLKRKLPHVRELLTRPEEVEKDEIFRKAFEEPVEQWGSLTPRKGAHGITIRREARAVPGVP